MLTLKFHKSTTTFPSPGQKIYVITAKTAGFGAGCDGYETWTPFAYGEDGVEYPYSIPFKELCQTGLQGRDIMVSYGYGTEIKLGDFLEKEFLWMFEEDYEDVFEFLGLEKFRVFEEE